MVVKGFVFISCCYPQVSMFSPEYMPLAVKVWGIRSKVGLTVYGKLVEGPELLHWFVHGGISFLYGMVGDPLKREWRGVCHWWGNVNKFAGMFNDSHKSDAYSNEHRYSVMVDEAEWSDWKDDDYKDGEVQELFTYADPLKDVCMNGKQPVSWYWRALHMISTWMSAFLHLLLSLFPSAWWSCHPWTTWAMVSKGCIV